MRKVNVAHSRFLLNEMKNVVHYRWATAAIFLLAFHVSAWGQIFINVGSHTLLANTPGQTVEISVFSSPVTPVQGVDFNVQIADGFPKPPGTVGDGPNITA